MVTDLAGRGARLGMVLTPRRPTAAAASTCPHKTAPIAPRIPAPNISQPSANCALLAVANSAKRLDSWVDFVSYQATAQLVRGRSD